MGAGVVSGKGMADRWVVWVLLAVVGAGALAAAAMASPPPANDREAILAVARGLACPTCDGESAAVSEALISQEMRAEIGRQLQEGRSPEEIRAWFAAPERYGPEVLLDPGTEGAGLLVWLLPVLGLAVGGVVLVVVIRRWSARGHLVATDDDRRLVEEALSDRGS